MTDVTLRVGGDDAELDLILSDALDGFNAVAQAHVGLPQELTVRLQRGEVVIGGLSGWTWGQAAAIAMMWIEQDCRRAGAGSALVREFEDAARRRGCTHAFVTSFTFQAPGFYRRLGYREIFRWDSVPAVGSDDVHLRKELHGEGERHGSALGETERPKALTPQEEVGGGEDR